MYIASFIRRYEQLAGPVTFLSHLKHIISQKTYIKLSTAAEDILDEKDWVDGEEASKKGRNWK